MKFIMEIELGDDAVQTYEHIVALLLFNYSQD